MQYGIYYAYWEKEWGGNYLPYVKKAADLGFDILELSCAGMAEMSAADRRAIRDEAEACGIVLTGGYGPKANENIASADAAVVENAFCFWSKTFAAMHDMGIQTVGGGLYSYWPVDFSLPVDKKGDLSRSIGNMKRLADTAAVYGITLCMEVLNRFEGYLLNTAEEGLAYVKAVDRENVKLMLDTFHMNIEEDSIGDAIRTAGNCLGHFHTGECNRRVPGAGRMPWFEIGRALRDIGYDKAVVMEPFVMTGGRVGSDIKVWRDLTGPAGEAGMDEAAGKSLEFCRFVFEG